MERVISRSRANKKQGELRREINAAESRNRVGNEAAITQIATRQSDQMAELLRRVETMSNQLFDMKRVEGAQSTQIAQNSKEIETLKAELKEKNEALQKKTEEIIRLQLLLQQSESDKIRITTQSDAKEKALVAQINLLKDEAKKDREAIERLKSQVEALELERADRQKKEIETGKLQELSTGSNIDAPG